MNFEEAILLIKSFWREPQFPFGSDNLEEVFRLEKEFGVELPTELRTYLASYAPGFDFSFETVGNPICLYKPQSISSQLVGYNWNPITSDQIDGWLPTWFLIGDEGADPIMVDLTIRDVSSPVFQAPHGIGRWDFSSVSHSIPLYMVLVSAQHHALTGFGKRANSIAYDEHGCKLIEPAASWYFSFLKELIPGLYNRWTESFSNA
jgi:hypothetical protein